eukprot:scaffold23307_cov101-Isochrysis_galbana.AAC.1
MLLPPPRSPCAPRAARQSPKIASAARSSRRWMGSAAARSVWPGTHSSETFGWNRCVRDEEIEEIRGRLAVATARFQRDAAEVRASH